MSTFTTSAFILKYCTSLSLHFFVSFLLMERKWLNTSTFTIHFLLHWHSNLTLCNLYKWLFFSAEGAHARWFYCLHAGWGGQWVQSEDRLPHDLNTTFREGETCFHGLILKMFDSNPKFVCHLPGSWCWMLNAMLRRFDWFTAASLIGLTIFLKTYLQLEPADETQAVNAELGKKCHMQFTPRRRRFIDRGFALTSVHWVSDFSSCHDA